ncbi:MAG: Carbonic anhydrase, gamma class [uncultured Thermomicrobiales bacterium]|uniref:Carbonic anhydrase, gamma class n=1 Tax=uncultured Thermomicrobiales bacterium TaxID=1645740 RepID=A0A6J4UM24_9BACT|nr:MAG: Carbonic anhydrase, gamma class [uncultured Thermomicrobiales bacterium]
MPIEIDEPSGDRAVAIPPVGLRAIVLPFDGVWPRIAADAWVAPGAVVVGDVEIGSGATVWFQTTIRGDVAPVRIGARSNVQDGAVLHVDPGTPCLVGEDVTIGHGAIVHGTRVGDGATIGMGAIVLSRSTIGAGAVVAAGALVAEDAVVAPDALVMGVPAKERGALDPERRAALAGIPARYTALGARYRVALALDERPERTGGR